jgi:uracil-DNA glycosylase
MTTNLAKTLARDEARAARHSALHLQHIEPLTQLVEAIRLERSCGLKVPYFDPEDGGIDAECLFVLEAPGRRAMESGFVSRDNPDETAKNFLLLHAEAKIPRSRTVSWNIVPWYIGERGRIRMATPQDIEEGWPYLLRVLELLPRLKVAVLVGRRAQRVHARLAKLGRDLVIFNCPHPSPLFINRFPGNRALLAQQLSAVAAELAKVPVTPLR